MNMEIHYGYDNLHFASPVVTLGIFDGVHLGHRVIIDRLKEMAKLIGGESVVVTFDPHPRLVLSKERSGISFLTTTAEKIFLLENAGVDHLVIIKFTKRLSNLEPDEFIRDILVEKTGVKHLIVGYDHHFGKGRKGDFAKIAECAAVFGFTVEQVAQVTTRDGTVSSTSIREALLGGRLETANRLLGYNYTLSGTVTTGRGIGRSLGFPTANIIPADGFKLIPADGVYAVRTIVGGRQLNGALSIGSNPTVSTAGTRSVEVNIFDFDSDIYGQELTVIFMYRLRDEIRFDSPGSLARQMELDKQQAIRLL
ncbi:MAG: bifunctional riboflavin kinase/FAD synthetase, partial [Bacteroidales bacterium]